MARSRANKSIEPAVKKETAPEVATEEKTPEAIAEETTAAEPAAEEVTSEEITKDPKAPVNIELEVSEEPQTPAPAASPEKVQTSVRERLAKKTPGDNPFVPSNPADLEKAAAQVAKEQGFPLNRGTSIGARLIARAQKKA